MFSFEYRFFPKSEDVEDYFNEVLSSYLASLYQNGQTVGEWNLAAEDDCLVMLGLAPDEDSLNQVYYNDYAKASYEKLMAESQREPELKILGREIVYSEPCRCPSPSSCVLFTTMLHLEPPVWCGDCGGYVPLYKLPYLGEGESKGYYSVLGWESTYKACDTLWINSGAGERFGLTQMSSPRSELTIDGLNVCRELAEKTGKPFYYYLDTSSLRKSKACRGCGDAWQDLEEPLAGKFDLLCANCGFVSISP